MPWTIAPGRGAIRVGTPECISNICPISCIEMKPSSYYRAIARRNGIPSELVDAVANAADGQRSAYSAWANIHELRSILIKELSVA